MDEIKSDYGKLLELINKQGFLLEDKTYAIVSSYASTSNRMRSCARNLTGFFDGIEHEVDVNFDSDKYSAVIECKKTVYSWLFFKERKTPQIFNIIKSHGRGLKTSNLYFHNHSFDVCNSFLAVELEEGLKPKKKNNKGDFSYSPSSIDKAIRQVLGNFEAYTYFDLDPSVPGNGRHQSKFYVPIIVTNTRLFVLEFALDKIDKKSDLKDFECGKEVDYVVVNVPYLMPKLNSEELIKSVLIVNIKYFEKLLRKLDAFFNFD